MRRTATVVTALAAWLLAPGCGGHEARPQGSLRWIAPAAAVASRPEQPHPPIPAVGPALAHEDAGRIDHMGRARLLEKAGDPAGALFEARRAAYDRGGEAGPLREIVRLARRAGDRERQMQALFALARADRDPEPSLELARLMLDEGDSDGALWEATLALTRDPDLAEAYHLRGRAELRLGMLEEAARDFESAVILNPRHAHAFNNLGYALLQAGEAERAIAPLERAAELAPHLAYVHNNLGLAYERAGYLDRAQAELARAVALRPGGARAASNLARVSEAIGSGEVAAGSVETARGDEATDCAHDPLAIGPGRSASRLLLGREAGSSQDPDCE